MEIKLTGSAEQLSATASTVSDAKRVYLCHTTVTATAPGFVTQTRLQDTSLPFDASTNPYNVTVGTVWLGWATGDVVLQKYASDMLTCTNVATIWATPIYDRD
jgi:hypothetical protein|tara:strand:+ start:610 stop:918 length:309 start_codon:yes stop_codon:yes gene_type:complete